LAGVFLVGLAAETLAAFRGDGFLACGLAGFLAEDDFDLGVVFLAMTRVPCASHFSAAGAVGDRQFSV
jgi:hypothetical protein